MTGPRYVVRQLDELEPVDCPCGTTRRAFVDESGGVASMHLLDVGVGSQAHYHRRLTEIYLVLEGEGHLELDGELIPVRPMTAVLIPPGTRHRPVGNYRAINVPVPAFDPDDEWFD